MRVNKDEATQFIDVKIAQFKELETALGEGTFSLEKYLSVYKETYIIISRLFSEKEWEEFNREVGFRPGSRAPRCTITASSGKRATHNRK